MCTAITLKTGHFYFGRNLDLDCSYNEAVTITPRKFPFAFRNGQTEKTHYAMIGMAAVNKDFPLYYEATNEKGLSMAGLNFPGNAVYQPKNNQKNIAPFELIPWLLAQCATVDDATSLLRDVNIWDESFSKQYPLTPLHWIIADREKCIVAEPLTDGLRVCPNPVGVLTNNPPFDYHLHNLNHFMGLSPHQPENNFSRKLELRPYSFGMGAIGLPGDLSSGSRFMRAAFGKLNAVCPDTEDGSVSQFFHILDSVAQQRGLNAMGKDQWEITCYSSCCNADKGIYYYTTYENRCITAVSMHHENLDSNHLIAYQLPEKLQITHRN